MQNYVKPIILANNELSEGVYAASGATDNGPKCDSIYMKGEWVKGYEQWKPELTYKEWHGCNGCPAYTGTGCGLKTHYVDSNYSPTYDVDNGKRKPTWEKEGHLPDEIIKW